MSTKRDIDPRLLAFFKDAGPRPMAYYTMSPEELQAAWDSVSAAIVSEWIKSKPGTPEYVVGVQCAGLSA